MKVSVITPSFNSQVYIEQTIRCVLNQTYYDWELLIVDDCSTDQTIDIVNNIAKNDPRVKLIIQNVNQGAAAARNTAIKNASGIYLAFLDSDDLWKKDKLQLQIDFMQENQIGFSFTAYEIIDKNGLEKNKIVDLESPLFVDYSDMLAKKATLGCSTVMLDRRLVGDVQMPLIRTGQDYALWLSILKKGTMAHLLPKVLTSYRITPGSISSNKLKKAKRQWYIYRQLEKISLVRSLYYFTCYAFRAVFR
jgi:teichuronic acid biosynthesis glycosyltransferase TuaG